MYYRMNIIQGIRITQLGWGHDTHGKPTDDLVKQVTHVCMCSNKEGTGICGQVFALQLKTKDKVYDRFHPKATFSSSHVAHHMQRVHKNTSMVWKMRQVQKAQAISRAVEDVSGFWVNTKPPTDDNTLQGSQTLVESGTIILGCKC